MTMEPVVTSKIKKVAKKRNPFLLTVLLCIFSSLSWLFFLFEKPVEAQVLEDLENARKIPKVEARLLSAEENYQRLNSSIQDLRRDVREQHQDIRTLMKKFDEQHGR